MEEGSHTSKVKLRLLDLPGVLSGWLHRLWPTGRLPFQSPQGIRTAVCILLCCTVVTLIYLAHGISNLSATQSVDNLTPIISSRTQLRSNVFTNSQRSVLSNSKPDLQDAAVNVDKKSSISNKTKLHEPSKVYRNRKDGISPSLGKTITFTPSDEFTMVISMYNRSDMFFRVLNHYCAMSNLARIVVVWNNLNASPPIEEWESLGPHPVPVRFLAQTENSLRNRFKPFPEVQTSAVLVVDDDVLISARDLQFAFRVWKQFPHVIVGFVPRKHVRSKKGFYTYGSFELDSGRGNQESSFEYSMVLTSSGFVHRNYLGMFNDSSIVPKSVHQLVDEMQNCEDIAMNVMVSQYLASTGHPQCSGLYVKPIDVRNLEMESNTGYVGLWHDPVHFAERSHCLNRLSEIYGRLPLVYSDIMMMPMYTEAMKCPK